MKSTFQMEFAVILFLFFSGIIFSQDVKQLFDLEKKFCKTLTEIGLSKSFIQFMDDDAVMFIPTPVNGKEYYNAHPNEFKSLFWEAEFAEISLDGNFGYTTGPWYIPAVSAAGDTTYSLGYFNTVWHKVNGEWKFYLDCGIDCASEQNKKILPVEAKLIPVPKPVIERNRFPFEELIKLDNDFSEIAESEGLDIAYKNYSSENIRWYRDNKYPVIGLNKVKELFTNEKIIILHMGGHAAQSGDLAYTYGKAGYNPDNFEFNYMKVWKREGSKWKIVLDVLTKINKK